MSSRQIGCNGTSDPLGDIEQRCVTALTADRDKITSDEVAAFIDEVGRAIILAEERAADERYRAVDPVLSPDAVKARARMDAAIFAVERLRTLQSKLEFHLQKVEQREAMTRWLPNQAAAKEKRDKLAADLRDVYLSFAERLTPILLQVADVDRECDAVNTTSPGGTGMFLQSVEEHARGRKGLLNDLYLPAWEIGAPAFWPRRR